MNRFFSGKLALVLLAMAVIGCQKELSFEAGIQAPGGTAEAILGGTPGNCDNAILTGLYGANLPLADTNAVTMDVTFTKAGTYTIVTDTCNGLYFRGSGIVTTLTGAPQRVTLKAFGTPTTVGVCNFLVDFKGSTCSFQCNILPVAAATTGDYFPTTVGSNWSYASTDPFSGPADTALFRATNTNATIATNLYRMFTLEDAATKDSSYYRKVANDYFQFSDLDVAGVASNFVLVDHIFLKDNVAVGNSWESAEGDALIGGTAVKMKLRFTLVAKDVDVVVGGQIFRNVIKVGATSLAGPAGGPFAAVVSYETWFAKGIGRINLAAPAPIFGLTLTRYQVN